MAFSDADIKPYSIRGINVYPFKDADHLIDYVDQNPSVLIAINADKVVWATDETRELINNNIGYCDGAGAIHALKKKGAKDISRIPGVELWLQIIKRHQHDRTFYLIGASKKIHDLAIAKLEKDFPGIKIVGHRDGYIKDEQEREALIQDVVDKRPDIVFVAMGSPRQELLMRDMYKRHKAIYQGLGGSFDVYSGVQSRAPKWMCNMNIEFLYRLIIRPKRIKRDIYKTKFAYWVLTNKI